MTNLIRAERKASAAAAAELERATRAYSENKLLTADEVAEMAQFAAARVYDDVFDREAA